MSEQQSQTAPATRPTTEESDAWYSYWKALGMSWRRASEIDEQRQRSLAERRAIRPDIEQGIYPFKDMRLDRADLEWLLATHESGVQAGPVDWNELSQRDREGLDLRGADLRQADLHSLPLARVHAGPNLREWLRSTPDQREMAAVHLEGANLFGVHLEGAILNHAHLEGADLTQAHLEGAFIGDAHLEGKRLPAQEPHAVRMGKRETPHVFWPADLREAYFDSATKLVRTTFGTDEFGVVSVLDAHWNGVNLAAVKWTRPRRKRLTGVVLGDERKAWRAADTKGTPKSPDHRLSAFEEAVRANRQMAAALRANGLSELADQFAYRAQVLQRQVLVRTRRYLSAFGSWLLDQMAGYGYKPMCAFISYIVVILVFAGLYLLNAQFAAPHLTWDEAIVLSISSFHGRGFFTSGISLGDTLARLAAGEAIIGLFIEITFIATFTQRFFAR
jgi:uncharacterized protein YjbI with pentapeptide repeats